MQDSQSAVGSGPGLVLPNFLCVGTQRAGTTWLYECMREHPQIFVPREKELNFFSTIGSNNTHRGLSWYSSQFASCPPGVAAVGEITPEYLLDPEAPARIERTLGQTRIIIVLRDPVSRLVSAWGRYRREVDPDLGLRRFYEDNVDYCVDRGMYANSILRYRSKFGAGRTGIFVYDDVLRDPVEFLRGVWNFLGVPMFEPSAARNRFNVGARASSSWLLGLIGIRNRIQQSEAGARFVDWLQRFTPINRVLVGLLSGGEIRWEIDARLRAEINETYRSDIQRTSEIVGRDLAGIWGGAE